MRAVTAEESKSVTSRDPSSRNPVNSGKETHPLGSEAAHDAGHWDFPNLVTWIGKLGAGDEMQR